MQLIKGWCSFHSAIRRDVLSALCNAKNSPPSTMVPIILRPKGSCIVTEEMHHTARLSPSEVMVSAVETSDQSRS